MSSIMLASILVFFLFNLISKSESKPIVGLENIDTPRAFFVFGDSLVDNGNNNFLLTSARADSPPYGIDDPSHRPTGRFSNGKNIADFIGEHIGAEPLLPYLDPNMRGEKLLNGANFASAGIGILDDTGIQFVANQMRTKPFERTVRTNLILHSCASMKVNIIHMPYQLALFENYQKTVAGLIGTSRTKELVNEAIFLISCGGNDFVNNYYLLPNSLRSLEYTLPNYVQLLISEYEKILMRLYDLGARKVLVTATGPLGCAPSVIELRSKNGECAVELQQAASLYNPQLVAMITSLNKKLGRDVFISVEAHHIYNDFVTNPQNFGFKVVNKACCGQGQYNGLGLCVPLSNLCGNRDEYVYWDGYHPTEMASRLIVQEIFKGTKYVNPMNLSTLMAMDSKRG